MQDCLNGQKNRTVPRKESLHRTLVSLRDEIDYFLQAIGAIRANTGAALASGADCAAPLTSLAADCQRVDFRSFRTCSALVLTVRR